MSQHASHGSHHEGHIHDHAHDHVQKPHTESVNTPLVMGVGVALFLAVVGSVALVYAFYVNFTTEHLADKERTTLVKGVPASDVRDDKRTLMNTLTQGGQIELPAIEEGGPKRVIKILPREQAEQAIVGQYMNIKK